MNDLAIDFVTHKLHKQMYAIGYNPNNSKR